MTRFWKPALGGVLALAALGIAGVAVATAPDSERVTAPFELHAGIGETVEAREFSVRVDGVRVAESLSTSYAFTETDTTTDGVWVVIDTTITVRSSYLTLTSVKLRIGDYVFGGSDILPSPRLIDFYQSSPGLPVTGSLVFEVPAFALALPEARDAMVVFSTQVTPSLDTVPMITVDLSSRPKASLSIEPPAIGALR